MFTASAIIRGDGPVCSTAHDTREDAARELFTKFPTLVACKTYVAGLRDKAELKVEVVYRANLPVVTYPISVVIHVSTLTSKIAGGYVAVNGKTDGKPLTAKEVTEILAYDPELPVQFLKV